MKKRSQELLNDYPEIVSKLLLLHESGLTIQNAFSVILKDYKSKNTAVSMHYAYLEIERTINKIQSGFSESGAYAEFGQRCHLHVYIKLGTLLEQNIKKRFFRSSRCFKPRSQGKFFHAPESYFTIGSESRHETAASNDTYFSRRNADYYNSSIFIHEYYYLILGGTTMKITIYEKLNSVKLYLFIRISQLLQKVKREASGLGVVEVIMILLVTVGLVLIFKSQITTIINSLFKSIKTDIKSI